MQVRRLSSMNLDNSGIPTPRSFQKTSSITSHLTYHFTPTSDKVKINLMVSV